jgi:hypothetical protein
MGLRRGGNRVREEEGRGSLLIPAGAAAMLGARGMLAAASGGAVPPPSMAQPAAAALKRRLLEAVSGCGGGFCAAFTEENRMRAARTPCGVGAPASAQWACPCRWICARIPLPCALPTACASSISHPRVARFAFSLWQSGPTEPHRTVVPRCQLPAHKRSRVV